MHTPKTSNAYIQGEDAARITALRKRLSTCVDIFIVWVIAKASIFPFVLDMFSGGTLTLLERVLSAGLSLVSVAIFAIFFLWLYRTSKALKEHTKFSPAIALGGWFIPGVNLVLPPLVLRNLYMASSGVQGAVLHVIWWVVTVAALTCQVFLSVFVAIETTQPALIDSLDLWTWLPTAQSFWAYLMPVSFFLLRKVVEDITQEATQQFDKFVGESTGTGKFPFLQAHRLERFGESLNFTLIILAIWPLVSMFFLDFILYTVLPVSLSNLFDGAVSSFLSILHWVAYTYFFVWLYRLFDGLRGKAFFSPALAVALWFIPVVNLIAPLFVLRDATRSLEEDGSGGVYSFMIWPLFLIYGFYMSLSLIPPRMMMGMIAPLGVDPLEIIIPFLEWGSWITILFFGAVWFYVGPTNSDAAEKTETVEG